MKEEFAVCLCDMCIIPKCEKSLFEKKEKNRVGANRACLRKVSNENAVVALFCLHPVLSVEKIARYPRS